MAMSGPDPLLQGLCVFPREVEYVEAQTTLRRVSEVWLVGDGSSGGAALIRQLGLWLGLGLRGTHRLEQFEVAFGVRDQANLPTTWINLRERRQVTRALIRAFGESGQWMGFHLEGADIPPLPTGVDPATEALFFRMEIDTFFPFSHRDLHLVPIVATLTPQGAGAGQAFARTHYLFGVSAFTTSYRNQGTSDPKKTVEDFLILSRAMLVPTRPNLPALP
jgi:hypothetical protein